MTSPRTRAARLVAIPLAAAIGLGSMGCGVIQNVMDTASTLNEFSDRLGKAAQLTYTAEYQVTGGHKVTLAQKPPNTAFISGDGRLIVTADNVIMCDRENGRIECQKTPLGGGNEDPTGLLSGVAGPGFVTPEMALAFVAAAAIVPGTDVTTRTRTYAGQKSLCADVSGIDNVTQGSTDEMLREFSVCVTESGVLASFSGTSTTGEKAAVELVSYATKVNSKSFAPPPGAKVVTVTEIQQ
jgi:hypothetical protein